MRIESLSAGGSGGSGGSNRHGVGSPEGSVSASPGAGYVQTDSGGAYWVKISGNSTTGWLQIGPGAAATGPQIFTGSALPEGVVSAPTGSIYVQIVAGAYTATYYKQTGSSDTGWV